MVQVFHDRLFQRFDTAEGSAANAFLGNLREEPFHLIQPRATRRDEVQVIFRMPLEPTLYPRRFVRAVIVHDQMDFHPVFLGHGGVDQVEELDELLLTMPAVALADDLPCGHVQGREQGSRAVAGIVMGVPLRLAGFQRQQRLGAIQRLDLGFFVHAQDESPLRRAQV